MIKIQQMPRRPNSRKEYIEIDERGIIDFYYDDYQRPVGGTRIDWSGGVQYTPEAAEMLASRLLNTLHLVVLTLPPATAPARPRFPIWINAGAIRGVKPSGSNSAIVVTRGWFVVEEDIATVRTALSKAAQPDTSTLSAALSPADDGVEIKFQDAPIAPRNKPRKAAKKQAPGKRASKRKSKRVKRR